MPVGRRFGQGGGFGRARRGRASMAPGAGGLPQTSAGVSAMGGGGASNSGSSDSLLQQIAQLLQGTGQGQQQQGQQQQGQGYQQGQPEPAAQTGHQSPEQVVALLQHLLSQQQGQGSAASSGQGFAGQNSVSGGGGQVAAPDLVQLVLEQMRQGGSAQQGGGGQGGSQEVGQVQPPAAAVIPSASVLQLAMQAIQGGQQRPADAGQQGAQGGSSGFAGMAPAGQPSTTQTEMQLSQELAANLKKLKAILGETQDLAMRIEAVLGQEGEAGGGNQSGGGNQKKGKGSGGAGSGGVQGGLPR